MRRYRGKRGLTAAQLSAMVIAFLFAVIALTITATSVYCGIPASEQISDMLLVTLE